jgi:hypothetical protein
LLTQATWAQVALIDAAPKLCGVLSLDSQGDQPMTPRILVLGGEGMLGHKMFQRLRERFPGARCTIRGSRADDALRRIDLFLGPDIVE